MQRELVFGELPGLVQDVVGHHELADVVHQRGEAQSLHSGRHEVHLFADVLRVHRHPLGMAGGVAVLGLERTDEHLHGLVVR